LVDSRLMITSQTATGHQFFAKSLSGNPGAAGNFCAGGALRVLLGTGSRRKLFDTVVGGFASDQYIVHMTFAEAGSADAYEPCILL